MRNKLLTALAALSFHAPADAGINYVFSEDSTGVILSYSGQLNTAALSFQGGLHADGRFMDILGTNTLGQIIFEFENFQYGSGPVHPSHEGVSFRYSAENIFYNLEMTLSAQRFSASEASGDTFGFYVFSRSGDYTTFLNLPYGYVSGSEVRGRLKFQGQTLQSLGLEPDESFIVDLPGGEHIKGAVIPEPALHAMLGGTAAAACLRRRRPTALS